MLVSCIAWGVPLRAQDNRLKGVVVDGMNNPLAGAEVETTGKGKTLTNESGEFSVACTGTAEIKVSYVGYQTVTQKIACTGIANITLFPVARNLNEVEVTATSSPGKSQLEQPFSIVRLREAELKRATGLFLDDAINTNVPGVLMERRTVSGGQQLNIRGYGNGIGIRGINSNFDSQGLKMYLNGIPVTDAEGITVMDDIDFGSISSVEISKGPSGALHGLAIAGVVHLQTQQAAKAKTSVGQEFMAGSYGLFRSTTRVAIGGENSSLLVNYGRQKFAGFMPHTASHKDFVNVVGDFNLNDKQQVTSYFGFSDSYDERNGELTKTQFENFDYSGNARYIKNNAHSAVRTFRGGISHRYSFTKGISNTTSFFGSSQNMDNSSAGGWTDKLPLNYGLRSSFDSQFRLSESTTLSGITGIEMQKMNGLTIGYGMAADSTNLSGYNVITSTRSNQKTANSTASYFTQWTLGLPKGFSVTARVGVSNMVIRLEDQLWALANNHPANQNRKVYSASYKNLVAPAFAVNKTISQAASVYASYSVGYKAPVSSNVLIATTGQLNTGLKPEKGTQLEIGTKGSLLSNRLFYTVALFNARFKEKFTTIAVQDPEQTATLYTYVANGGDLVNKGAELLAKYTIIDSKYKALSLVRVFANLTYSDFKYNNFRFQRIGKSVSNADSTITEDYSGKAVAGVAPWVYNVGLDIDTKPGLYGNVTYNYRSEMFYTSDGLNQTNPFCLVNAKLGFRKTIHHVGVEAYAGANNITGSQYYYMVFVNQLPDAYIPSPTEINYFGGVNLKYIF